MYKCCFLVCFCARQRARWLRTELTYHTFRKSYQTAGPIDTKFGTHVQIHLRMDIAKQIEPQDTRGHFGGGGFRGSKIQVWAVKRLDRLAPNLVHVCGFVWNGHRLNTIRPSTLGGGGLGGHNFKSQVKIQMADPIGTKFGTHV